MAKLTDKQIVDWIIARRDEAQNAKTDRMSLNKDNFDMFFLRHDFSHKKNGQSREILSRQQMAVIQNRNFYQQALAKQGDWWKAEAQDPNSDTLLKVRPAEITKLTNHMLEQGNYFSHVGNCVQNAQLGSLAISKCCPSLVAKPKFVARKKKKGRKVEYSLEKIEDKTHRTVFHTVRAENYYPDPTGKGLYEIEDMWPDYHELLAQAKDDEDFDLAMIQGLPVSDMKDAEEDYGKARETGQNPSPASGRHRPKITEFWGTILDPDTGEVCYENVQAVIANDTHLIMKPRSNPLWYQGSPYTATPMLEVSGSVWHVAPMDAPTKAARAMIEMYNLMVDAGMMQVHGVNQLRKDALDNVSQIADGIQPGTTLLVNSLLPPQTKVMEPLTTVQIPPDAFNIFQIQGQEFNAAALTSDARMGMTSVANQKATAIVEASQTITSVSEGIAQNYESKHIAKELQKAWQITAQNWDRISREEFVSLFGEQRGSELHSLPPEEVFASTVNGIKFRVFGISMTLAKTQDFQKLTTMLQTIAASPQLMEAYLQKYDLNKTLGEMMTALNIDKYKLEIPQAVQNTMVEPEGAPMEGAPDMMSQVPDPSVGGSMSDMLGGDSTLMRPEFPGSPATKGY